MLPVNLRNQIRAIELNSDYWERHFDALQMHADLKSCLSEDIEEYIHSLNYLALKVSDETAVLLQTRMRVNPLTGSQQPYWFLTCEAFFNMMKHIDVVKHSEFALVDSGDDFTFNGRNSLVSHQPTSEPAGELDCAYAQVELVDGTVLVWTITAQELYESHDIYEAQIFGGATVAVDMAEFASHALCFRMLKTLSTVFVVNEHPWLAKLTANISMFFNELFQKYQAEQHNRLAGCVEEGKFIRLNGSRIAAKLRQLDTEQTASINSALTSNVVPLHIQEQQAPLNSEYDETDLSAHEDVDYSSVGFGDF